MADHPYSKGVSDEDMYYRTQLMKLARATAHGNVYPFALLHQFGERLINEGYARMVDEYNCVMTEAGWKHWAALNIMTGTLRYVVEPIRGCLMRALED